MSDTDIWMENDFRIDFFNYDINVKSEMYKYVPQYVQMH